MSDEVRSRLFFVLARAWRAGFFGAKVLLWADGKKRLRLMSLWCQRQLSAKFLRFLKKTEFAGQSAKFWHSAAILRRNQPKKRSIAVHFAMNSAVKRLQGRCDFGGSRIRDFIDTSLIFLPFSPSGAVTVLLEKFPIAKRSKSPKLGKWIKAIYH